MIAEGVTVASFAGAPSADVVARLNDAGSGHDGDRRREASR